MNNTTEWWNLNKSNPWDHKIKRIKNKPKIKRIRTSIKNHTYHQFQMKDKIETNQNIYRRN